MRSHAAQGSDRNQHDYWSVLHGPVGRHTCLTPRENTERPITVTQGTNELMSLNAKAVGARVEEILSGDRSEGRIPAKWDGKASERIGDRLVETFLSVEVSGFGDGAGGPTIIVAGYM